MKKDSCFISVVGGAGWGVEDDKYLVKMAEEGKIAGFSVENEHKGSFPKSFKGNVFLPATYAWYTQESLERVLQSWIKAIIGVISGKYVNRVV